MLNNQMVTRKNSDKTRIQAIEKWMMVTIVIMIIPSDETCRVKNNLGETCWFLFKQQMESWTSQSKWWCSPEIHQQMLGTCTSQNVWQESMLRELCHDISMINIQSSNPRIFIHQLTYHGRCGWSFRLQLIQNLRRNHPNDGH